MSVCDRCDRPATIRHSLVLFTGTSTFTSWDLQLCKECADKMPENISFFLEKEPTR